MSDDSAEQPTHHSLSVVHWLHPPWVQVRLRRLTEGVNRLLERPKQVLDAFYNL